MSIDDRLFNADGPWHVFAPHENHIPYTSCWCNPEMVVCCQCDDVTSHGLPHPRCVMCAGTGYVPASYANCTLIIHFNEDERKARARHRR